MGENKPSVKYPFYMKQLRPSLKNNSDIFFSAAFSPDGPVPLFVY
jgi:hypothetical protein